MTDWAARLREIGDNEDTEHAACIDCEEAYEIADEIDRLRSRIIELEDRVLEAENEARNLRHDRESERYD